jgi:hypothetical protein
MLNRACADQRPRQARLGQSVVSCRCSIHTPVIVSLNLCPFNDAEVSVRLLSLPKGYPDPLAGCVSARFGCEVFAAGARKAVGRLVLAA